MSRANHKKAKQRYAKLAQKIDNKIELKARRKARGGKK